MTRVINIRIDMTSDWHVGEGAGLGSHIDRACRRDHDGLVFVPARTLVGMWRDAAELLAAALDAADGADGTWSQTVVALFGSQPTDQLRVPAMAPAPARIRVAPARFDDALRERLVGCSTLADATTFLSPGVAIDHTTGAAQRQKYYVSEVARMGARLVSTAHVILSDVPEETADRSIRFLRAAAEGIESLGGKRRRGRGRCAVRTALPEPGPTSGFDHDAVSSFFTEASDCGPLCVPPMAPDGSAGSRINASPDGKWTHFQVDLTAREPLFLLDRSLGNVATTLRYVPGAHILALLGSALGRAGINASHAITRGHLLVRDALPIIQGARGSPMPLCFERHKQDLRVRTRLLAAPSQEEPADDPNWKQARSGYVWRNPGSNSIHLRVPDVVRRTHSAIKDNVQRPDASIGGVYTYEAMAVGTRLRTVISAREDLSADIQRALDQLAKGHPCIGRAKKAGYGAVGLSYEKIEALPFSPRAESESRLVLLLHSGVLTRTRTLRPAGTPKELEQALLTAVVERLGCQDSLIDFAPEDSFLRPMRSESWQVRWGLARPSLIGVSAGSVLVFSVRGDLNPDQLERLAMLGVGERRSEGFGEVEVNPAWLLPGAAIARVELDDEVDRHCKPHEVPDAADVDALSGSDYGRLLLDVAANTCIRRAAETAGVPAAWKKGKISNAQVGNLRSDLARSRRHVRRDLAEWSKRQKRAAKRSAGTQHKASPALGTVERLLRSTDSVVEMLREQDPLEFAPTYIEWLRHDKMKSMLDQDVPRTLLLTWCEEVLRGNTRAGERS